jgi:phage protein D
MPEPDNIRSARPTLLVGGKENASLAEGLLSLVIVENTSGLYRCETLLGNLGTTGNGLGFLYFDRSILDFGKRFEVKIGGETLFDGRIMGLEAVFPQDDAPKLRLLAEDRFQDLRMTRRTRAFADTSDADAFRQISNEHGLTPDVDITGPTHKLLAQVNQSDLAFLRERARAIDAELWVQGDQFHAKARTRRQDDTISITHGNKLREFTVLADLAGQSSSVSASGWDVASKAALQHEATDSILGAELNGDESGASILSSAIGERKESLAHTVPLTNEEAQAQAEAFFKMSARRFVTGRGVAETDSKLRVGNLVDLQGLGPLFNGKYYLSEVRHRFDGARGIRTEFLVERPGLGRA